MSEAKTVKQVLEAGADYLAGKGVENPRLACELLASRLLRCKRLELYLSLDNVLPEKHLEAMRRGVKRVAAGEPVQYVLGEVDFMGHMFKVDRRALIPRPETELLVEKVLACRAVWDLEKPRVVDVGTGCGCIVVTLSLAHPKAVLLALDTSEEALALARGNAAAQGVDGRIGFANGELCDVVEAGTVDLLVANLPYIPSAQVAQLPAHIRDYEPRPALDGGPDGLAVIGPVVQDAALALQPGGVIFLEIGHDQADAVSDLLKTAGFSDVAVAKDLAGHDRIVTATVSGL